MEAIGTKVLMLKLRNSNTYIPQYETWAGANDGLVAEAAQQHCSELQHRKSLPVAGHWTWNHTNTKRLHTTFPTVPYCTQCSAGSWPTLEFSHNAAGSRAGAGLGWSHPFIAFFPVVLNIWILSMAVFSKTEFWPWDRRPGWGLWPAAAAKLKTGREKRKSFIQFQKQNYSKSILWVYLHVIWLSRGLGTGDSSW